MLYKIIEANSPYNSHVFEELEYKINEAARDGYRLKERSIQVFREERGPNEMAICRVVAVMVKKAKEKKAKTEEAEETLP